MSEDSVILKTKNTNYKTHYQASGKYRYSRIFLDSGSNGNGGAITLDPVATIEAKFKLPTEVYNLEKTYVSGTMTLPAPAAKCNVLFADVALPWVQSIKLGTMGGFDVVNLQNSNLYSRIARKLDTDIDDFECSDILSGLTKSDLTSANYVPSGYTSLAGNSLGVPAGAPAVIAPSPNEPLYSRSSAAATAMQVQFNVPLSAFTNTLLSMPQDMYFGPNSMYLTLNTAPSSKLGYVATAATNPITGAAVLEAQPVISNLCLYLALEKDEVIANNIKQLYNSGQFKFMIPYTYSFKTSSNGAVDFNVGHNFTPQHGKKLKRVIYIPMPVTETLNVAYDHSNYSGSKIANYQTYLNSNPIQDARLNCVQASNAAPGLVLDDWRENKQICKGSVIQGPACYQLNWFHCDSFCGKNETASIPDSQIFEGLDMDADKLWTMSINSPSGPNLSHYVFATFARELILAPGQDPMWGA